jgi:hypothetical protein
MYVVEDGKLQHRTLDVGRPTEFEDVVVALVEGTSPLPIILNGFPRTLREGARFTYHALREMSSSVAAPFRSPNPMLDVRSIEPNNFAHLLLEVFPLYLFARRSLQSEVTCVFRNVQGRFRELIDFFEVDAAFTTRRLEGEIVKVSGTRALSAYDLLSTFDSPIITFLPDTFDHYSFDAPRRIEKMYIARRGTRSLLNHGEVERLLAARGYETIYMEDHSIPDQLGLAAQAKHVVAIHGAGMASLIMNRKLSSVIEFLPRQVFHSLYPVTLSGRVDRYIMLMPEYDERNQYRGWSTLWAYKNEPFAVDLASLERALDEAGS